MSKKTPKKANKKVNLSENDAKRYSCPMVTITDVVEFINKVTAEGGFSKPMPRDKVGILLGKHQNTFIYPLSAGTQYGLLTATGTGYMPTKRYVDMVSPVDDTDRIMAHHQAMNEPELYRIIIERYNGKQLPEVNGFMNLLKNEFGFVANTAERGVRVFFENAHGLKLIGDNRRLRFIMPDGDTVAPVNSHVNTPDEVKPLNGQEGAPAVEQKLPERKPPNDNMFTLHIQLTGDDKTAELRYPKNITKQDIAVIRIHLNGIEERLKVMEEMKSAEKIE